MTTVFRRENVGSIESKGGCGELVVEVGAVVSELKAASDARTSAPWRNSQRIWKCKMKEIEVRQLSFYY